MSLIGYCPRCGNLDFGNEQGQKHKCSYCENEILITKYSSNDYFDDRAKIKRIISDLYRNSSEFDEELFNARENKVRQERHSSMNETQKGVLQSMGAIPNKNILKCPKCGSTAVSIGARGFSIVTGFLGSGQTVNRCGNCGYKWKPKG